MKKLLVACSLFLLALPLTAEGEARRIDFRDPGWELSGERTRVETLDGRTVLRMTAGRAIFREIAFQDGTIEFDLHNAVGRSFAFLQFRITADGNYEEVYFRPHKSNLPDALQYTPAYRGRNQWQLYHGPGGTAPASLPAGEWTHIRLEVQGRKAALFVGDSSEPQLVIPRLGHEAGAGAVAFRASLPRNIETPIDGGTFANLVVRPGVVDYDFSQVAAVPEEKSAVKKWQLSKSFVAPEGPVEVLPEEIRQGSNWQTVSALPSGVVELARHVAKPEGSRVGTVLARLRMRAARPGVYRLDLGFSDQASVFLDGRLLFAADHRYSFDAPSRLGLINFDQAAVYLHLGEGEHEVIVAVTDRFGGWGLMAKLDDSSGLTISP